MTAPRIEDYALIGDTNTAALISRDGSLDWACFPRFDAQACFAALLGTRDNGRWRITPREPITAVTRRYQADTLILETELTTASGRVRLVDFMPVDGPHSNVVRRVEGLEGKVTMTVELAVRFGFGRVVPWARRLHDRTLTFLAGPDALALHGDVPLHGENLKTVGQFDLAAGERRSMTLTWYPSHETPPPALDTERALGETRQWWQDWSSRARYEGPWREAVGTSLRVLKALTYGPTGGMVAAPTTSLPEQPAGARNWDYRYCWLRDATLTLYALMLSGYAEEAEAWREWLLRAAAGDPRNLQVMYGVAGERDLTETEAPWLAGFGGAKPVRIGNAAHDQLQLDVYGELVDTLYQARCLDISPDRWAWPFEKALLANLEARWSEPDHGIWEVRGEPRHFTHSKIMAWVAFDRAVRSVERFGLEGPLARWRSLRDEIHAQICARGFDASRGTFTRSYGSKEVDAALLMMPLVGFLPASDPRVAGTVRAIEQDLLRDGLVMRYRTEAKGADGLPPGEGLFLPCSFWLADVNVQLGRRDEARALFERLLSLRNDVGLLAEEYDPTTGTLLGNFPQAFSHLSLINTAYNLSEDRQRPATHRARQ